MSETAVTTSKGRGGRGKKTKDEIIEEVEKAQENETVSSKKGANKRKNAPGKKDEEPAAEENGQAAVESSTVTLPPKKGRGAKGKAAKNVEDEIEENADGDDEKVNDTPVETQPPKRGSRARKEVVYKEVDEDVDNKKKRGAAAKPEPKAAAPKKNDKKTAKSKIAPASKTKKKEEPEPEEEDEDEEPVKDSADEQEPETNEEEEEETAVAPAAAAVDEDEEDEEAEEAPPTKKSRGGRGKPAANAKKDTAEKPPPAEKASSRKRGGKKAEEVASSVTAEVEVVVKKATRTNKQKDATTKASSKRTGAASKTVNIPIKVEISEEVAAKENPVKVIRTIKTTSKRANVAAKTEKIPKVTKQEEVEEDQAEASKTTTVKKGRGAKIIVSKPTIEDTENITIRKTTTKRKKEAVVNDDENEDKIEMKQLKAYELSPIEKEHDLKICTWNVAGIRAWFGKGGIEFILRENPDIICLQETKCLEEDMPAVAKIMGYHPYYLCKTGGYAGIAIYSKIMPMKIDYGIGDARFDEEGRIMTAEYEKFFLICVYVPNSGRKLVNLEKRLAWNKLFLEFVQKFDQTLSKPVIICGDMNVSHLEIDLANPKTNKRSAGFTQEERDGMTDLLSHGFIDTFRHLYPEKEQCYTYWTYMANARSRNVGWRLDYFIVSERMISRVVDNVIRSEVHGSDHCPVTLVLNMKKPLASS